MLCYFNKVSITFYRFAVGKLASPYTLKKVFRGVSLTPYAHICSICSTTLKKQTQKIKRRGLWLCKLLGNVLLGYMVNFSMIKVNQVFILQLRRKKLDKFTIQLKTVSDGPEEKQFKLFTYIVLSIFSLKKLYFKL